MPHIDVYFSTLSPFTYLIGTRLVDIATATGATVTYRPLDIMQLFARTGGTPPAERHPNRQEYRAQDLVRRAALAGLPLKVKPAFWPTNAAPASYAIIAAQQAGGGDLGALLHHIGTAVWAEDKNIADDDVLRPCLAAAGFDPDLVDKGMMASAEEYGRNLEQAVLNGVFGAPFFITDQDARFWGQDRLDDLEAVLTGKI